MLRPYQTQALEEIEAHFSAGRRGVMLVLPTGAGKTTVFSELMLRFERRSLRSLLIVRGRALVQNASERLSSQGVPHAVYMAGSEVLSLTADIKIASVDTLYRRKLAPAADLVVIDECHTAHSEAFAWVLGQYPTAKILAVTATPFHKEGFQAFAEVAVAPVRVTELIAQGYLVPGRYFVPETPDLSAVKKSQGEYNQRDLEAAMNQARLFAPIVETWQKKGEGRPTLLFATSVSHSERLTAAFNAAGVPSEHLDADSSLGEREAVIGRLKAGSLKVVCSVGVLAVGVDIPPVSCIVMARPTLSYNLHIQMLGRGTRPYPGKENFIFLDHAGNTARHGFYEQHRPFTLDGKPPPFRAVTKTCERCACTWIPNADPACPGLFPDGSRCGHVNAAKPKRASVLKVDEKTELVEVSPEDREKTERERFARETIRKAIELGHRPGAAWYKIKSRYGPDYAQGCWRLIHSAYKEAENA